jgi:hypothetical protein
MSQLQDLTFAADFLGGTIPISLANCTKLEVLKLSNNHIGGVITEKIVGLPFLTMLSLAPNHVIVLSNVVTRLTFFKTKKKYLSVDNMFFNRKFF